WRRAIRMVGVVGPPPVVVVEFPANRHGPIQFGGNLLSGGATFALAGLRRTALKCLRSLSRSAA
ncbi:MAG: hypothetical protein KF805_15945, partial [Phycisphaeraceae bacterium]|nr:hypothetical protein [Phycisphaeraceae bacterium]